MTYENLKKNTPQDHAEVYSFRRRSGQFIIVGNGYDKEHNTNALPFELDDTSKCLVLETVTQHQCGIQTPVTQYIDPEDITDVIIYRVPVNSPGGLNP
jgi:hypothetical protein